MHFRALDTTFPSYIVQRPYRPLLPEHGQRRHTDVQPLEDVRRSRHILRIHADHGSSACM